MGKIKKNYFELNDSLDFLEIDHENPLIASTSDRNLLNTIIYSSDRTVLKNTYTKGINRTNTNPENKENIARRFSASIKKTTKQVINYFSHPFSSSGDNGV